MTCQPWNDFSVQSNVTLSEGFVIKYADCLNFDLLSQHYFFTTVLLELFYRKLNLKAIIKRQPIEESFLRGYSQILDRTEWEILPYYQNLSSNFSSQFKGYLNYDTSPPQTELCYVKVGNNSYDSFESVSFRQLLTNKPKNISEIKCYEPTKKSFDTGYEFHSVELKNLNWRNFIKNHVMDEQQLRSFAPYFDEVTWFILPKFYDNLSKGFQKDFNIQLENGNNISNKTKNINTFKSCYCETNLKTQETGHYVQTVMRQYEIVYLVCIVTLTVMFVLFGIIYMLRLCCYFKQRADRKSVV